MELGSTLASGLAVMALDAASCRKYKVPELLGGLPDELKKDVGFGEGPIGYARGLEGYTNEVIRKRR